MDRLGDTSGDSSSQSVAGSGGPAARRRKVCAKTVCVICQVEKTSRARWSRVAACGHTFCTPCIHKWAESCSQCPLCKKEMGALMPAKQSARAEDDSTTVPTLVPIKRLQLQEEDAVNIEDSLEESLACTVCGSGDDAEVLLICDGCELLYHTGCLPSPLDAVPRGIWHGPCCAPADSAVSPHARCSVGRPPGRASFLGPGAASVPPLVSSDDESDDELPRPPPDAIGLFECLDDAGNDARHERAQRREALRAASEADAEAEGILAPGETEVVHVAAAETVAEVQASLLGATTRATTYRKRLRRCSS